MDAGRPAPSRYPSIPRRLAALAYEALLAVALLLGAGVLFYVCVPGYLSGQSRHLFQIYLTAILASYFAWCWCRGGQTLPMKTWKLRLVRWDKKTVPLAQALWRFALAAAAYGTAVAGFAILWKRPQFALGWILLAPGAITLAWALVDRERQFLHDRLAGTRIMKSEA